MAKRKSPHPFQGRWLIEHMDQWDVQKESEELQPFFEFEKADIGQFQFGVKWISASVRETAKRQLSFPGMVTMRMNKSSGVAGR